MLSSDAGTYPNRRGCTYPRSRFGGSCGSASPSSATTRCRYVVASLDGLAYARSWRWATSDQTQVLSHTERALQFLQAAWMQAEAGNRTVAAKQPTATSAVTSCRAQFRRRNRRQPVLPCQPLLPCRPARTLDAS